MVETIVFLAIVFTVAAYIVYRREVLRNETIANRWSWLIWASTIAVEAATFEAISQDLLQTAVVFVSVLACVLVAASVWRYQKWNAPSWSEIAAVIFAISAIFLWIFFNEVWWAHVLVLVAIPVSFLPTWLGLKDGSCKENVMPWMLWTIGDGLSLVVVLLRFNSVRELPYMAIEFLCHLSVWFLAHRQQRKRGG